MARVLVTGGGGFLGCAIAQALAARGDEVVAFDRTISAALERLAAGHDSIRPAIGEITEWPHVADVIARENPDKVVHAAAIVGVPASVAAPIATMRVNVEGSLNLFEAMRLSGVRRVVHISSEEVYGTFAAPVIDEEHPCRPLMAYGISKAAVERLGRSYAGLYDFECINVRTCWVYGPDLPRPRVPKILLDAALAGRSLHLPTGGEFRVDHVFVADTVQGVLLALDQPEHAFDVYNIATGNAPSLAEIVEIIKELVPGADITVGPGAYRFDERIGPVQKGALDITRAREHLGYAPRYDIRAGLAATIDALRRR